MTKEAARLRAFVTYRTDEVEPMLERLATVNDDEHLGRAIAQVLAAPRRYRFTSDLEAAILAHLGHRIGPPANLNAKRNRRARGLDCPQCHDSGWTVDADLTARPCDCTPRPTPEPDAWIQPRTEEADRHLDPDTFAAWIGRARQALKRTEDP